MLVHIGSPSLALLRRTRRRQKPLPGQGDAEGPTELLYGGYDTARHACVLLFNAAYGNVEKRWSG